MRTICLIVFLLCISSAVAQSPLSFYQIERTDQLDPTITSQRSLVIISTLQKDNEWKELATYMHKAFRVMGIDAVNYMHYLDYNASPVVKQANDNYANSRQINFYIIVEKRQDDFRMSIQNRTSESRQAWYAEAADLRQLILNLAVTLKRIENENQNFLISVQPEFLSSLPMFEGTRYPNYPTRIKRMRMAIMELPKMETEGIEDEQQLKEIEAYNRSVDQRNEVIRRIIDTYPNKLDMVPIQSEKELYRQGYQYVIYYLHSSAESLRNILAYESINQDEYVSQLTLENGQRTLISYPANQTLYKWYIKQTAISDLHVGRYWDAHEDFEQSFTFFINRLKKILK